MTEADICTKMIEFNRENIEEFRSNGGGVRAGARGRPFEGAPMILLHHRGAKTGVERVTPLGCQKVGESYAVFGSKGGALTHPAWYRNLMANPHTRIEVGTETFDVTTRQLNGTERQEVWERQKGLMPTSHDYEEETKDVRQIPVVILERPS
jgi:deazaflavin-dependent oxidoreductase (nitroreductase family)